MPNESTGVPSVSWMSGESRELKTWLCFSSSLVTMQSWLTSTASMIVRVAAAQLAQLVPQARAM